MTSSLTLHFLRRWTAVIGGCVSCLFVAPIGRGADPLAEPVIAATVNGDPVLVSEVARELQIALGAREIDAAVKPYFQAKTLAQLIDRRLIIQWLRGQGRGASDAEVALEISRLEKRLKSRDIALADYLVSRRISEAEMRRLIEWQIGWRKFLARYLTDENLEKYFKDHRREFDGTRMRVAHILFKVAGDDLSGEQAVRRARAIRESIVTGATSVEEAAKQHSTAPTAASGGDLGFIERHKPMHEAFARAAFALHASEVSPPIITPFGVHLVRCIEIEPGQRTWQDARDELTAAVTLYLFNWAADKERPNAEIRFTKALPHFAPGSEDLAD